MQVVHISIHAPTRGATAHYEIKIACGGISIHAPTRGATTVCKVYGTFAWNFNPRSHEGSDASLYTVMSGSLNFNPRSHEGSDQDWNRFYLGDGYFNPRSHEGSDATAQMLYFHICIFQSTLPRGERPCAVVSMIALPLISIHAPTRGATDQKQTLNTSNKISIHAPTRGATS